VLVVGAGPAGLEEAGIQALYRVGDCIAPRPQVADAIFDGHRLAREIDADDPATPLPWIREHARSAQSMATTTGRSRTGCLRGPAP
jgi:dimethylamine/trimethylamine dehydrogenase